MNPVFQERLSLGVSTEVGTDGETKAQSGMSLRSSLSPRPPQQLPEVFFGPSTQSPRALGKLSRLPASGTQLQ